MMFWECIRCGPCDDGGHVSALNGWLCIGCLDDYYEEVKVKETDNLGGK